MRALLLACAVMILASCATTKQDEALNAKLFNYCVNEALRDGVTPTEKCGVEPANYRGTFSDWNAYYRDQNTAQQTAPLAPSNPQVAYAQSCFWAAMAAPTRTGTMGERMANANLAYNQCLNGYPMTIQQPAQVIAPPLQLPQTTNCHRSGENVNCTTQ